MKTLLLGLFLLIATKAAADVRTHLVFLHHEEDQVLDQLPPDVLRQVIAEAIANLQAVAPIRVVKITRTKDPFPKLTDVTQQSSRFYKLMEWAQKPPRNYLNRRKYDNVHFIVSPMYKKGLLGRTLGGLGWVCGVGTRRAFSISNASTQTVFGADRVPHAIASITHEVGHVIGGEHINDSPNAMNTAILFLLAQYPDIAKTFLDESKTQISNCLTARGLQNNP